MGSRCSGVRRRSMIAEGAAGLVLLLTPLTHYLGVYTSTQPQRFISHPIPKLISFPQGSYIMYPLQTNQTERVRAYGINFIVRARGGYNVRITRRAS